MKINAEKVLELVDTYYYGNRSRFSKDIGVDPSHIHHALKSGIGGGKKIAGAIIKFCKEKNLNFEDYIEL